MITAFNLHWDGDRAADYPREYAEALEKELMDEIEYEAEMERKWNELCNTQSNLLDRRT